MSLLSQRYELLFVPQCTGVDCDDRVEGAEVAKELTGAVCFQIRGRHAPDVLMRFYETADATLTLRLHGAVFSAMAGVPVAALDYLPKVRSFMEAVGLRETCIDLERAVPEAIVDAVERARLVDGRELAGRCEELASGVSAYLDAAARLMELPQVSSSAA